MAADRFITAKLTYNSGRKSWAMMVDDIPQPEPHPMVSLAELLAKGSSRPLHNSFAQRLSLALLLAYAFLELGQTPWFPYDKTQINVWFRKPRGSLPIILQPFLEVRLGDDENDEEGREMTGIRWINGDMPCLPALGKLIFEVISGSSVGPTVGDVYEALKSYPHDYPDRAPFVLGAVNPFFEDFKTHIIHGHEDSRIAFLEKVIYRLNKLLAMCKSSLQKEVRNTHSLLAEPSSVASKRRRDSLPSEGCPKRSRPNLSEPMVFRTNALCDDFCLHDDGSQHPFNQVK
jgi:hypothetical protein